MSVKCSIHPDTAALYRCRNCRKAFCSTCVDVRVVGVNTIAVCPDCGDSAELLRPEEVSLGSLVSTVLRAPFTMHGLLTLGGAALVSYLVEAFGRMNIFFVFNLLAWCIVWGILAAFICMTINHASKGEIDVPLFGDITDWVDDLLMPGLRLLVAGWTVWIPAAIYFTLFMDLSDVYLFKTPGMLELLKDPVLVGLGLFGVLYMPMAFTVAAIEESAAAALNPLLVIGLIFRAPRPYLLACFMFYSAHFLGAVLSGVSTAFLVLVHVQTVVPGLVHWFVTYYTWYLAGSALGLLVYRKGEDYGLKALQRPGTKDISDMPRVMPYSKPEVQERDGEQVGYEKTRRPEPIELKDLDGDSVETGTFMTSEGIGVAMGVETLRDLDSMCNRYLRDCELDPRKVLPPEDMLKVADHLQARNQVQEAVEAYKKFGVLFRDHPKAPWALLKSAFMTQRLLGRQDEAKRLLDLVVAAYPDSKESVEARRTLAAMKKSGSPGPT